MEAHYNFHWPVSLLALNQLTTFRNEVGYNKKDKFIRKIVAEFGYAGLVIAGIVEAAVKAIFVPMFFLASLIPSLTSKSIKLSSENSSGIIFCLFAAYVSFFELFENIFVNRKFDNVFV